MSFPAEKAEDGRLAIALTPGEGALMQGKMRDFVAGVRQITDALWREDMEVASAARLMGRGKAHDVPAALIGRLPNSSRLVVHGGFDQVARAAVDVRIGALLCWLASQGIPRAGFRDRQVTRRLFGPKAKWRSDMTFPLLGFRQAFSR